MSHPTKITGTVYTVEQPAGLYLFAGHLCVKVYTLFFDADGTFRQGCKVYTL